MSETEDGNAGVDGGRTDASTSRSIAPWRDARRRAAGRTARARDRAHFGGPGTSASPNRVASAFSNLVASAFRRKTWILVPVRAAAVIVLAVMLPGAAIGESLPVVSATPGPQVVTTTPRRNRVRRHRRPHRCRCQALRRRHHRGRTAVTIAAGDPRGGRAGRTGADTTAADSAQVAALDGPAPLVVEQLTGPTSTSMNRSTSPPSGLQSSK